ncbi:MAG: MFS transporter, partial [Dehalococcoidia bacterium]
MQTFVALRNVNYRYLWVSSGFISAGNQVQQIAMGFLVFQETGSTFWVGTVLGIRALPILLIGPLAGVAVDRIDRKKLFLGAQLGLVVIAFFFGLDVFLGTVEISHILAFSFLLGLDSSLNQPVRQAMIVNTVVKDDLTNAIALNNLANSVLQSIGPLISAALIAWLTVAGNFFVQSAAYLIVFFILLPMRTPYREEITTETSVTRNFLDGLRYLKRDQTLLLLILLVFIPSLFVHSVQFQFAAIADKIFSGGPWTLGIFGASLGAGAFAATGFVAFLGHVRARGKLNMTAAIMVTVSLVLFGLSSNLYLSFVLIGVVGFFNTIFRLANNALVQSRTPDELRGRITSIYVLDHGFQPLGS